MHDDHKPNAIDSSVTAFRNSQRTLNKRAILSELRSAGAAGISTTKLVDRLGLPVATVNRLLDDLTEQGQIVRIDNHIRLHTVDESVADLYVGRATADSHGIATEAVTSLHTSPSTSTETSVPISTEADPDRQPVDKPGWPRWASVALHKVDAAGRRVWRFVEADPAGTARLMGTAIGALAATVVALNLLSQLLKWAVNGNPLQDLAAILPARELATDPIIVWLTGHTAGTGITGETAVWIWGITGLIVWFTACCHHLGSQLVLWPAYGAASVAMTWAGTTAATQRPVAAATVAIAWAALSLLALNRRPLPRPVTRRYAIETQASKETR